MDFFQFWNEPRTMIYGVDLEAEFCPVRRILAMQIYSLESDEQRRFIKEWTESISEVETSPSPDDYIDEVD